MKKFLTYLSLQTGNGLQAVKYEPVDNNSLKTDVTVRFPVSILVNSYADNGEEIEIVCVMEDDNSGTEANKNLLSQELDFITGQLGAHYTIREIHIPKDERAESHLDTFRKLIETINDGDQLYACMTYGTKPFPILEMMALSYAYQVRDNVSVESIVYGKINRSEKRDEDGQARIESAFIYELSSLFFMTRIVSTLAERKVQDPDAAIRELLNGD